MKNISGTICPKVSVIVPFYNVESYIRQCAESLLGQTLLEMEFIFVDDCGTDCSAESLKNVIAQYPNRMVQLLRMPTNQGVSAARKIGIEAAHGEYLGFCDSDDWVEPNMYESLYKTAVAQEADIVGCGFNECWPDKVKKIQFPEKEDSESLVCSFQHFGGIYGALWNKIIRKSFFLKENIDLGKNLIMWEDSCTLIPLRLKSNCTIFVKECLYNYRIHQEGITSRFSLKKVMDSIEATKRLEKFFMESGKEEMSAELISFLKINAKEVLLRYPTPENVFLWRNTFPECISTIWQYPNWSIILKLRAWLVAKCPLKIALVILKIARK